VYSETALLRMSGYSGEIIFLDSGKKCDVKAVYCSVNVPAGRYAVTVNRQDDDWYEIYGQDIYIKTISCISLALMQEAVLDIAVGGYGTLIIEGNRCISDLFTLNKKDYIPNRGWKCHQR
jgi:hypothetical protein